MLWIIPGQGDEWGWPHLAPPSPYNTWISLSVFRFLLLSDFSFSLYLQAPLHYLFFQCRIPFASLPSSSCLLPTLFFLFSPLFSPLCSLTVLGSLAWSLSSHRLIRSSRTHLIHSLAHHRAYPLIHPFCWPFIVIAFCQPFRILYVHWWVLCFSF